jgi:subtilisin
MRRRWFVGCLLATLVVALVPASSAGAAPRAGYVVVLKGAAGSAEVVARRHAGRYGASVRHVYRNALSGYSATLSPDRVAALRADPSVAAVVPDRTLRIQAQSVPTGINRIDGELSSTVSGNGSGAVNVDVAVIDTGITSQADLNVVGGTNCVGGSSFADDNGHGTHVAGTVAARDNAEGVVGVAPGARLYAVKVLNAQGSGTISQIICGID